MEIVKAPLVVGVMAIVVIGIGIFTAKSIHRMTDDSVVTSIQRVVSAAGATVKGIGNIPRAVGRAQLSPLVACVRVVRVGN